MNVFTKLTVAALSAAGIAGGVAVAQTSAAPNSVDGRSDTANYGTPPGAPLKRDGSLSADAVPATAPMGTTSTTTATDTSVVAPAADTSSTAAAPAPAADTSMQPRADRN